METRVVQKSNYKITYEVRDNSVHSYYGRMGRSTIKIDCPFCGNTVTAYVWSLAGCGKKCYCGVLHYHGTSRKEIRREKI